MRRFPRLPALLVLLALAIPACTVESASVAQPPPPEPTGAPLATRLPTPLPSLQETSTTVDPAAPTETAASVSTEAPVSPQPGPCEQKICYAPFQFPFSRPILPPGRDIIDVSYRFGTTAGGKRDPHHGVEFLNSKGTPVMAAAPGEVVVAGDDLSTVFGAYPNMYGILVVLQHDLPEFDAPVFTLYAHLSKVDVQVGDLVETGQLLGEVGATGAALGSHLHFEVRYGENTYAGSRNPELWLRSPAGAGDQPMGALAGRVLDEQGQPVILENIVVEGVTDYDPGASRIYYLSTYEEKPLLGQAPWGESFAIGDLPAGEYEVTFVFRGMQHLIVEVRPGELTLVTYKAGE